MKNQRKQQLRKPVLIEPTEAGSMSEYVSGFNIVDATQNEWRGGQHFFNKWQLDVLKRPTPRELIRQRDGKGGTKFLYVPAPFVIGMLNRLFHGNWDFETEIVHCPIPPKKGIDEEVIVKGRLTVRNNDVTVVKEQFGQQTIPIANPKPDAAPTAYIQPGMSVGDALKGAASDALRKCAFELGVCADLYTPAKDSNRPNPANFEKYENFPEGLYGEVETPKEVIADTHRRVQLQERVDGLGEIYKRRFAVMLENITKRMAPENAVTLTLSNVPIGTLEHLERWVNDASLFGKESEDGSVKEGENIATS